MISATVQKRGMLASVILGLTFAAAVGSAQSILTSWRTTSSTQIAKVREYVGGSLVQTWPSPGLNHTSGGQASPAQSDIQQIWSTPNDVFIYTNDLASHVMGPWYNNNAGPLTNPNIAPRWPASQNLLYKFPRTTTVPGTKASVGAEAGVTVNGIAIFNWGDAFSYNGSLTEATNGAGIWNRLAYPEEGKSFDPAMAHATPTNGSYHHHSNPYGIRYQLNDNVSLTPGTVSTLDDYNEDLSNLHHSPILGWAYDGLPIYGPYGYTDPNDSGSAITRMISGFVLRNGTNGTTNLVSSNPNPTGRTTLPTWAAATQNRSATLIASEYGPATWQTVGVGPGSAVATLGRYAEDYDHLSDTGNPSSVTYHLDKYNHRFCKTPEFPSGVDAYFVTILADGTPAFPNMLAGQCYANKTGQKITNGTPPGPATLSFTAIQGVVQDGSTPELNYTINPTKGATDQALGRFAVAPNSNGHITHTSYTITLGSATGISNLKLYRTTTSTLVSQVQFGSTIVSPSGSNTFTDAGYTTSAITFYWLRGDVAGGAGGTLDPRLTNVGVTAINVASFAGNDPLANGTIALTAGYTWTGSISTDYQVAGNWTPNRNSPASDDNLTINSGATITNVPTQTIGTLTITNNSAVSLASAGSSTLTLNGGASSLTIDSGSHLQVGASVILTPGGATTLAGQLTIDSGGRLNAGTHVISGPGTFTLIGSSTLAIGHVQGIAGSGATGQIQCDARDFNNAATYIYNGSSAQITGLGLPSTVAGLTISNSAGGTLSNNVTLTGLLTVSTGNFGLGTSTLVVGTGGSVSGTLTVPSGATLDLGAAGIGGSGTCTVASGATVKSQGSIVVESGFGTIQTATKNLSPGAHWVINGSALQFLGSLFPATVATLTIDNPTTVGMGTATTVTTQLILTQGALETNGMSLVVNTDGDSAVTRGTGFIKGAITRFFDRSVGAFRLYPVGTHTFAGVDIVESPGVGTGYITVSTTDGDPPSVVSPSGVLNRYWTVTASGFDPAGCQLQFHYLDTDVAGVLNENTMALTRYSGGVWTEFTPDFRDIPNNVIMKASLPGFSIWSAANPGAVPVALSDFSIE